MILRFRKIVLPLLALCAGLSSTSNAQSFSLEQVMGSPFPDNLVTAAKAPRIAWVFDSKGARNVWTAEGPDFAARRLTDYEGDNGEPIVGLRLSPDGRFAVYVRGGEPNEADRSATPEHNVSPGKQLVLSIDTDRPSHPRVLGEMACGQEDCEDVELSPDGQSALWATRGQLWIAPVSAVTPARQLTNLPGQTYSPRWSPDGRHVAFVNARGDHSFIGLYEVGSKSVQYLSPSIDHDIAPRWSPDGRHLAFIRLFETTARGEPVIPVRTTPWCIWVAVTATGASQPVWCSTDGPPGSYPRLTEEASFLFANDEQIVFASEQDGWNHLYYVLASGGPPTLLTPGSFDVEDVALSADRASLLYSSNQDDADRRHIWRVDLKRGAPRALTRGESIEWMPLETAGGQFVVCLGSTATSPAMPYKIESNGLSMLAGEAFPSDYPRALVVPKQVTFPSKDGTQVHGQLFVPVTTRKPRAALLYLHGGPIRQMLLGFHYLEYYHNVYAMNQYLAQLGFVVLAVNYRSGTMYGRAFREAQNAGWRGASEYQDVLASAEFLRTLPMLRGKPIGLWGGSYGGWLTALALARNSDVFAAGVDLHGVHDWVAMLERSQTFEDAIDAHQARMLARASSPIAGVETWTSPVLLIQGDDDRNVPFSQMVDLAQTLRAHQIPSEELVFPDELHTFLLHKTWLTAFTATADFLQRTLRERSSDSRAQ